MPDGKFSLTDVNWRASLPFLHIFRAFRLSIHPMKLMLALAAIVLIYLGGRALDSAWPQKWIEAGAQKRPSIIDQIYYTEAKPPFISFLGTEMGNLKSAVDATVRGDLAYPTGAAGALLRLIVSSPWAYWQANQGFFTLLFLWTLLVVAFFGGAIARMSAVQVARDEQVSIRQALRFAWRKLPSFLGAPLIPVFTIFLIGLVLSLGGSLAYIPVVGPILVALLLFIALAAGLLLAMLIIGGLLGWPLMYPTIAAEASDAFDATSRSYSYVVGAPWRLLFYWVLAVVMGALTYLFVRLFLFVALVSSRFFVGWWHTGETRQRWDNIWPTLNYESLVYAVRPLTGSDHAAALIVSIWVYLLLTILGAFALSYFISVSTIIYYLLRRQVDATAMDEVFIDRDDDEMPPAEPPAEPPPAESPTPAAEGA
jgi:hypothetical protein